MPRQAVLVGFDRQLIRGDPSVSKIIREVYRWGFHEFAATQCMKTAVKENMIVVDVGADKGYNTLLAAKRVGPKGRVLAFEPVESARNSLLSNVGLNSYGNVTVLAIALADKEGLVSMYDSQMVAGVRKGEPGIRSARFDSLPEARAFGKVDFVKVDVEGAELSVLRGMEGTLDRDRPELLVEVHPEKMLDFGATAAELVLFLQAHRYRVKPLMLSRKFIREILERNSLRKCRLYCKPEAIAP